MSGSRSSKRKKIKKQAGIADDFLALFTRAIDEADEEEAAERVVPLRAAQPNATPDELAEVLIKKRCLRTGAIGAVTSGGSMVPGLGTVVSLTFGVAADIGLTFREQAELVLEIAAVYERELDHKEKRNAVLMVTGVSMGASQALERAGTKIAQKTSERLAQRSVAKAIPVIGIAASAGTNALTTYIIGQRANAYFSLGPEAVADWSESVRALTGVDERKLIEWLTETTEHSWTLVKDRVQDAAGAVIMAGKSSGELVVVSAGRARQAAVDVGKSVVEQASATAGAVAEFGKRTAATFAAGAVKAGQVTQDVGRNAAGKTIVASGWMLDHGKKTRGRIAAEAEKASGTIENARDSISGRAHGVKERFSRKWKGLGRGKVQNRDEEEETKQEE